MAIISRFDLLMKPEQARQARAHQRAMQDGGRDPRRDLADYAEITTAAKLRAMGYHVARQAHQSHFDLLATRPGEAGAIRIEVKASTWSNKRQRYQARMRGNVADVVVFVCQRGPQAHTFVLPADQVSGKTLDVYASDPREYSGWMAAYLEAWHIIEAQAGRNPWQMALL